MRWFLRYWRQSKGEKTYPQGTRAQAQNYCGKTVRGVVAASAMLNRSDWR